MLFNESFNIFMLDSEADEIHCPSLEISIIADRGTERLYLNNGTSWNPGIKDFQATDWEVIKYEVDGNVVITGG